MNEMSIAKSDLRKNLKEAERGGYLSKNDLKESYHMKIINKSEYRKMLVRLNKK